MDIVILPAKKMNVGEDGLDSAGLPCFLSKVEILKEYVRNLSHEEVRNMRAYSERAAALNYEWSRNIDLTSRLIPTLLPYEGVQYQYMAPGVFEQKSWGYVQSHLWIPSGFHGILRPSDGIVSYRLKMQTKVVLSPKEEGQKGITSLYKYWGDLLYRELVREDRIIVNLVSKEHSKAIEPYLTSDITYTICAFGSLEHDKQGNVRVKVKATETKMVRGEMIRFVVRNVVEESDGVKAFNRLGYRCSEMFSGERKYVLLKQ